MYSRLSSIIKPNLRQAETTDTRLGIRRDDSDNRHKKRQPKDDESKDRSLWEDTLSVSITALKVFLKDLVEEETNEQTNYSEEKINPQKPPNIQTGPAAKAVMAYQHTNGSNYSKPLPETYERNTDRGIKLSTKEQKTIQQMLIDLDKISKQNVHEINIHKNNSFLEGVAAAIQSAKEQT